jgi:DNA-binding MurR/RpiR family transcriptional regulator
METLPPTERRLAEFILDFPGDLAGYNASELAALVKVSNATVTRFVRRLGYSSYEEARRHAREQRSAGSPLFTREASSHAPEGSIAAHLQRAQDNLAATFDRIDEATIEEVVDALVKARCAWFLGYRNNRSFAAYLRWQLAQFLAGTHVIPGPGETLAEYAPDIGPQDVLVVFALRRSPRVAATFATGASRAGAQVLYITDQLTPSNVQARWVLRCHTAAPGPLDSHVTVMLLCELLATRAMDLAGAVGHKRLSAVEASHEALDQLRSGKAPATDI